MDQTFHEEEEFASSLSRHTLLRLLKLNFPHRLLLAIYIGGIIGVAVMDSYYTYLSKRLIDEAILPGDMAMLNRLMIHYGLSAVGMSVTVFGFIYGAGLLGELIRYDLCRRMFAKLQSLSLTYFDRTPVGWLMARLTSDSRRVSELVSWGFLEMLWGSANILIALGFMAAISWKLALIMFAIVPILLFLAIRFQQSILREHRIVRRTNSQITGEFNESITGIRVVKSLVREKPNFVRFRRLSTEMFVAGYGAAWLSSLFLPSVQLLTSFAVGAIIWFGGWQFTLGDITIGGVQAFVSYITFMLFPIQEMSRVFAEMQQAVASGERVFSLLDAEPDIVDAPDAETLPHMRGDIEFERVHFAYEEGKPVFANLNLYVRQGEMIALVGPTGAGKSTLVNLVARFYEPVEGVIRINGRDLKALTQTSIQSCIGMVLQVPHLFAGSILDNIRYGRLEASEAEILQASRLSGAHEFIQALPDGYDSQVGEEGVTLSVGQRQLISIARAILADPDIFIMDEATSSVDTMTEALIQKGMAEILQDRTSFVIAHRLSTIRQADRILVIRQGGIAEMGTHSELIQAQGYYYDLYSRQFREEKARNIDPFHAQYPVPATH